MPRSLAQSLGLCLLLCGLVAGGAADRAAAAEALPRYDLERFCTWAALSEVAIKPQADAGAIRKDCRQREETAEEALTALWAEMPDSARRWCAGQILNAADQVKAPTGSYELLYECLLDETVGFVPNWN
ncbi:MAG: hypothetical protein Kilf2KO_26690 [Rhodospirillales bacterium]